MIEAAFLVDRLFYPPDSAMPISDTMTVLDGLHTAVLRLERVRATQEAAHSEAVYG